MNSETDSPRQLDSHQQLPQMEIEIGSDLIWKAFFILLVAVNLIFFYLAGMAFGQPTGGIAGIVIIPLVLSLLLIDFLAVFFYRKHHPQGRMKNLWNIVLITLIFVPTFFASLEMLFLLHIDYYFFPFSSLHASIVIAIIVTLLIIRFLPHKFRN